MAKNWPSNRLFVGSAIRSNALILRLDPDDDEAESKKIDRVERQAIPDIAEALGDQLEHVRAAGELPYQIEQALETLPTDKLRDAARATLVGGAEAGVNAVFDMLQSAEIGVNWGLAHNSAIQWATNYSYELVSGINATSRSVITNAVTTWARSGEPLPMLYKNLEPHFGKVRAKLIASTEVTRAYAEGSFYTYEQAGFSARPAMEWRPPAHPGCRCFVAVSQEADGQWYYIWLTGNDDRVCSICGPRHETVIGFAGKG